MDSVITLVLLAFMVWREIYFSLTINKLINKLMSRDFFAYKRAESLKSEQIVNKPTESNDEFGYLSS